MSSQNFNAAQSAYRKHHSTETALLKTVHDVYTASDSGSPTLLVSLDLSAAFDIVDHITLLNHLTHSFGISGPTIEWLRSYLCDRSFRVQCGTSCSSSVQCDMGVPQGSVLGPLLFSIYTSPIAAIASNHQVSNQ